MEVQVCLLEEYNLLHGEEILQPKLGLPLVHLTEMLYQNIRHQVRNLKFPI
jgi:hypothetical protein